MWWRESEEGAGQGVGRRELGREGVRRRELGREGVRRRELGRESTERFIFVTLEN